MKKIYDSARTIACLEATYPGKWEYNKRRPCEWRGEQFSVIKKGGVLIRTDTGKPVKLIPKQKRSHYIHILLQEKFGGEWERVPDDMEWISKDHNFGVRRTSQWQKGQGKSRPVYIRTDDGSVVYRSTQKVQFYREEGE